MILGASKAEIMAEDWHEIIDDYNAAYRIEEAREHGRALRIQRVVLMKKG